MSNREVWSEILDQWSKMNGYDIFTELENEDVTDNDYSATEKVRGRDIILYQMRHDVPANVYWIPLKEIQAMSRADRQDLDAIKDHFRRKSRDERIREIVLNKASEAYQEQTAKRDDLGTFTLSFNPYSVLEPCVECP